MIDSINYYYQTLIRSLWTPGLRRSQRQPRPGNPRNHNYVIHQGRVIPCPSLRRRMRRVERLYQPDMDSLLDIGCCRGAYVLSAAQRPPCRRAMGIDVEGRFIQASRAGAEILGLDHVRIEQMKLEQCVGAIDRLGGPFHTVLLLGTYHYLFWGSHRHPDGYLDHDRILQMLTAICSRQVIFSARLEVRDCPTFIRERAKSMGPQAAGYTTDGFLRRAERLFSVQQFGSLGAYRLLLMQRR
jgi:PAS domain-containing protein